MTLTTKSQFTKIAEEVVARQTDLDALDTPQVYAHALRDLELAIETAVDDAVHLWLETRRIGKP